MTDSKIGTWHMHSETTMDLGYRPNRPTSFPPLHCPRSAGARKRALCRCATCCEVGCRRVRTASIAVHERILTYRIATHCKPIANRSLLKNRACGVVGKCRQLKIRFARHFGQARGLARRNEKKVLLVYRNYTNPRNGILLRLFTWRALRSLHSMI